MIFAPVLRFYKNFVFTTGLVSTIGLFLCYQAQSLSFTGMFTLGKIITNVLTGFIFYFFKKHDLFYYNNLGFSTAELYVKTFTLDMLLWLGGLTLIFQL